VFSIPKLLIFVIVLTIIYFVYFKKKKISSDGDEQTMVECAKCSVFVSAKESIIKDSRFYCSKECAK
jgi:uncharacterized protein